MSNATARTCWSTVKHRLGSRKGKLVASLVGTLIKMGVSSVPLLNAFTDQLSEAGRSAVADLLVDAGKEITEAVLEAPPGLSPEQLEKINRAIDEIERTYAHLLGRLELLEQQQQPASVLEEQRRDLIEQEVRRMGDRIRELEADREHAAFRVGGGIVLAFFALFAVGGLAYYLTLPPGHDWDRSPGWPDAAAQSVVNSVGMHLRRIPAGEFTMGSPPLELHRVDGDAELSHKIRISRAYYMGTYEVTQKQYADVMAANPSNHQAGRLRGKQVEGIDTHAFPVENVSREQAREFCRRLSGRPQEKAAGRRYRLPFEAEWEYACRGGGPPGQVFHFGNSLSGKEANFGGTQPGGAAAVGTAGRPVPVDAPGYAPNGFGLYHMHGNVWEWCEDWHDETFYTSSPPVNPVGPRTGKMGVIRGGSFASEACECRCAHRRDWPPSEPQSNIGFRVVCMPALP
jgi:formylglycine-generating enzyme required for sulfatase activity